MATTFNTGAVLDALVALCTAAGAQTVYRGAPESLTSALSAFVTVAGAEYTDKTTGNNIQRRQRYTVVFGYRVKGQEQTAEATLATVADAFTRLFYHDRTLGDLVNDGALDGSIADTPLYQTFAGMEYRLWPLTVSVTQTERV
jgi:hypothetical protein